MFTYAVTATGPKGFQVSVTGPHPLGTSLIGDFGSLQEMPRPVQPSRPAASWSGCSWFSTVWPRSAVETRTYRAARLDVAITEGSHGSAVCQAMIVGWVSQVAVSSGGNRNPAA